MNSAIKKKRRTDGGPTDRATNGQMDRPSYRVIKGSQGSFPLFSILRGNVVPTVIEMLGRI